MSHLAPVTGSPIKGGAISLSPAAVGGRRMSKKTRKMLRAMKKMRGGADTLMMCREPTEEELKPREKGESKEAEAEAGEDESMGGRRRRRRRHTRRHTRRHHVSRRAGLFA